MKTTRPPSQHRIALAALASCGALLTPAAAHAQAGGGAIAEGRGDAPRGELQTVTVTAERKARSIQKTSIALEAVAGTDIAEQGLSSGAEILKNVANVEIQGAARGNMIAIRGIGSDLPPGMGESAVSTNYDGIYNFRAEMTTLGLFDLDRVEVLRGPQGTLYGRNAAAGAVNFISRDPSLKGGSDGHAALEVGSHGLFRGEFGANAALGSSVALRISGASISRDGFLSDGFNDAQASAVRVKALVQPGPDTRLVAGVERLRLGGKGPGFIAQDNWNNADTRLQAAVAPTPGLEQIGYQSYHADKTWLQLDQNLGFATLTVIPAHQSGSGIVYRKYDASRPPGSEEQFNADPANARQNSLEARLASPAGAALEWVAGIYGYDMLNVQHCLADISCTSSLGTRDTTTSKAVFGQATVPLDAGLRAVAGVRHTRDRKTAIGDLEGHWHSTDGKVGAELDLGRDAMTYLTYATAYRPGGFNSLPGGSGTFEAEKLKSLELGLKSRWLRNRLQFNGALFRTDYRNYQAVDFAFTVTGLAANFRNVPRQTIQGVEAELRAVFDSGASLRLAGNYLDATLGDLRVTNFDNSTTSLAGLPLPHAPKTSLKLGGEFPIGLAGGATLTLRADARYTARQYVSLNESDATLQPAYTQADLSAQWRSADDRWGLNLYVKNATDYVPKVANFVGWTMVGNPRTWGAVLTTRF